MEVVILPNSMTEKQIEVDFRWEVISFTENEAKIQVYFDLPESVSATSSEPDNVQITFWAGDLFQAENGNVVRPGLTISAPVVRQVNKDDYEHYRKVGHGLGYSALVVLILGFILSNRM